MSEHIYKDDEMIDLDNKTIEKINEGVKSGENGRRWTLDEATKYAKKRRKQWRKIQKDQTA